MKKKWQKSKIKVYPKWWRDGLGCWEFIEDTELIDEWNLPEIEIDRSIIRRYVRAEKHYLRMCHRIAKEIEKYDKK